MLSKFKQHSRTASVSSPVTWQGEALHLVLQSSSNNGNVAKYVAPHIKMGLDVGNHKE